jgi:hypothetical protein
VFLKDLILRVEFLDLFTPGYDRKVDLIIDFLEVGDDSFILSLMLHQVLVFYFKFCIFQFLFFVEIFSRLELT